MSKRQRNGLHLMLVIIFAYLLPDVWGWSDYIALIAFVVAGALFTIKSSNAE